MILCNCQLHSDHLACDDDCNHDISDPGKSAPQGSYIEGRDLSKFDQDILKILCAVLMHTGPVEFTMLNIDKINVDELVVERLVNKDGFIASYGEVEGVK